jgi:hypothetical protein
VITQLAGLSLVVGAVVALVSAPFAALADHNRVQELNTPQEKEIER